MLKKLKNLLNISVSERSGYFFVEIDDFDFMEESVREMLGTFDEIDLELLGDEDEDLFDIHSVNPVSMFSRVKSNVLGIFGSRSLKGEAT